MGKPSQAVQWNAALYFELLQLFGADEPDLTRQVREASGLSAKQLGEARNNNRDECERLMAEIRQTQSEIEALLAKFHGTARELKAQQLRDTPADLLRQTRAMLEAFKKGQ